MRHPTPSLCDSGSVSPTTMQLSPTAVSFLCSRIEMRASKVLCSLVVPAAFFDAFNGDSFASNIFIQFPVKVQVPCCFSALMGSTRHVVFLMSQVTPLAARFFMQVTVVMRQPRTLASWLFLFLLQLFPFSLEPILIFLCVSLSSKEALQPIPMQIRFSLQPEAMRGGC